jgi:hypothetical protein
MWVVGTRSQLVACCEDGLEKSRRRVKSSTNHHRSTKVQVDEKGLDRALAEWVKLLKMHSTLIGVEQNPLTKHNNRLATAILEINMGWFFGDQQDADPTKHLDPKLKEFLKKETPEEYVPALKPPEPPKSSLEKVLPPGPSSNPEQTPESDNPSVPSESQFPDGRYADLWKTYVPLYQQEGAQNMDKMRQVVEAHKDRQYLLGKAALENCAEEHMVVSTCFATGGMRARMTMCKRENSQFARCYEMQSVSELPSPKNRIVDANSES